MYGNEDILQAIIHQNVKGYKSWQVEPVCVSIENNEKQIEHPEILSELGQAGAESYREVCKTINLNNDIWILTSNELDIPISATLTLESLHNLFAITKAEFSIVKYYKYQVFSNFLKISLKDYGSYVPFQLEFLRIIPTI